MASPKEPGSLFVCPKKEKEASKRILIIEDGTEYGEDLAVASQDEGYPTNRMFMDRKGIVGEGSEGGPKSTRRSARKILARIKNNSEITIEELAQELGISDRAVKKHLLNLKSCGCYWV